ncbi:MAG: hypothetical protein ACR2L8_05285 [Solirubrobacteraceae bacterium]
MLRLQEGISMRIKTLALVCTLALAGLVLASSAQAYPQQGGGYPAYPYEGLFPNQTPCRYSLKRWADGQDIGGGGPLRLRYFYSSRCGSFARVDNAPRHCRVVLERSSTGFTLPPAWVLETVDPGINYAYTKVADNLQGRLSRSYVQCGNDRPLSTPAY